MLQGTLDIFSLDEVLGLLASAGKSGVLTVQGDRGVGHVDLLNGGLASGAADRETGDGSVSSVIFELLRFESGSFDFDASATVSATTSEDLAPILAEAHERLAEWRTIEAVVPSLEHEVSLRPTLADADVTIDVEEWATIVAVGEGAEVGAVGARMGLGEVDVSRRVKGLLERSLVVLAEPAAGADSELPRRTSVAALMAESLPETDDEEIALSSELAGLEIDSGQDQSTVSDVDAPGFDVKIGSPAAATTDAVTGVAVPATAAEPEPAPIAELDGSAELDIAEPVGAESVGAESVDDVIDQLAAVEQADPVFGAPEVPAADEPAVASATDSAVESEPADIPPMPAPPVFAEAPSADPFGQPDPEAPFARRADDVADAFASVVPDETAMAEHEAALVDGEAADEAEASDEPAPKQRGSLLMRYLESN